MKRCLSIVIISFVFLTGCTVGREGQKENIQDNHHTETLANKYEVIADQLKIPWSIDKIGETIFVSERVGSIVKIENGQTVRQKVLLDKPLSNAAEAGLLGFVLSPEFLDTNEAYAYYTYESEGGQFNRIVILTLENDTWKEKRTLVDRIPSGAFHHGGRLKIGTDGKLYASTGDATIREIAQDTESLGGKILRMNLDGSVPSDNPFPKSYVFSYGHRNPQGLTWTEEGTLYESEHGQSAHDEINLIEAGKNYGWLVIQGNETKVGMESPLFHSGDNETWAPSGMAYKEGKLYVAALRGTSIIEFDLKQKSSEKIVTGLGRIRDVYIDGDRLYFISNNTDGRGNPDPKDDKLYQISLKSALVATD
ncbi:sorbosone dehydrogenase family protein [Bacillus sp. 03113]|uniref:PQQ-dependent sugar dehydrogenase n=1 Tax=Bacillus sp. 03113 TaxID=2578211 RepID=UPI0011445008|nr:PQQ-dependent sugar dehydrogenase [Bacillus sp. 03113]